MSPQRWKKPGAVVVVFVATLCGTAYWGASRAEPVLPSPSPADPAAALAELRQGNLRYVRSARVLSTDTVHDAARRRDTAETQHPFVTVLCCSDSRVCPEFIFDQRPGSIFEVRNAGNVVDDDVMASLEYAVEHLRIPLIVVLGHKRCGAVQAVCRAGGKPLRHHLAEMQKHMHGVTERVPPGHGNFSGDFLNRMALENARDQSHALLRESPVIRQAVEADGVRLVSGLYDMETGVVSFFDPE